MTGAGVVPRFVPRLVPLPPMFGQSWVDFGVVVPPFGVVDPPGFVAAGAGEADGSGLAAKATATPPTTRSVADRTTVATDRRSPPNERSGSGSAVGGRCGWGHSDCDQSVGGYWLSTASPCAEWVGAEALAHQVIDWSSGTGKG